MTETEMQLKLGKHFGIKNICIPNVLMIGEYRKEMLPEIEKLEAWQKPSKMYEADIVYITKSDYLVEVEIKVDINDFRNDFNKKVYHSSPLVSALYYAFLEELYKKYEDEIRERVNGIAGIITVSYDCKIRVKAPKRKEVSPLTDIQIKDFMRIGCMKWFKGSVLNEIEKLNSAINTIRNYCITNTCNRCLLNSFCDYRVNFPDDWTEIKDEEE